MAFDLQTFQRHVTSANPHYSRFKTSSLEPLQRQLVALGTALNPANAPQVAPFLAKLPQPKRLKYKNALDYLAPFVAEPVRPQMRFDGFKVLKGKVGDDPDYPLRFYHTHTLTWECNLGDLVWLKKVGTRERVTHRSPPSGPPFDPRVTGNIPMSFTQGATTNAGANLGENKDDHSVANPSLAVRRPLATASVVADQVYEYTTDGHTWREIPGARYVIEKGVRRSSGAFVFFFSKRAPGGGPGAFHFEVEYPIEDPPAEWGKPVPVFPPGFLPAARLEDYAVRILGNARMPGPG